MVTKYDTAEPEKEFVQNYIYEFYIATAFYHAMLNNFASETSSRIMLWRMSWEMLDKSILDYNKLRQAKITVELCEIISRASAVWS